MSILEVKSLKKVYTTHFGGNKVEALKNVNFNVEQGEYVALMGESGSGKSTLMNILGCLDRPTGGEYLFEGKDISRATNDERAMLRNQKIGFVFQNFNLLPRTSALDNVIMPLTYTGSGLSAREQRERGRIMLEKVGLKDRMKHHPSQLSGGQQQRVAIARALINNPPVLFADEPTGNLDSQTSIEVMNMFTELNRKEKITIILVTHSQETADCAKRVIRLADGMIKS